MKKKILFYFFRMFVFCLLICVCRLYMYKTKPKLTRFEYIITEKISTHYWYRLIDKHSDLNNCYCKTIPLSRIWELTWDVVTSHTIYEGETHRSWLGEGGETMNTVTRDSIWGGSMHPRRHVFNLGDTWLDVGDGNKTSVHEERGRWRHVRQKGIFLEIDVGLNKKRKYTSPWCRVWIGGITTVFDRQMTY